MKCETSKFKRVLNVSKIGLVLKGLTLGVQIYKKLQQRVHSLKDMSDLNCLRWNKVNGLVWDGEREEKEKRTFLW